MVDKTKFWQNEDSNKILHLICKGNFSGVPTDLTGVEQ